MKSIYHVCIEADRASRYKVTSEYGQVIGNIVSLEDQVTGKTYLFRDGQMTESVNEK